MTDEEFARLFPNVTWPKTFEGKRASRITPTDPAKHIERFLSSPTTEDKIPPDSVGSLRNYVPTPRDRLADVLYGIYGNDPEGKHRVDKLMNYADFFGGSLFGAYDTSRAVGEGRYKDAVVPGLTAVAPFAGKPVKMLAGAMKRKGQYNDVIENLARSEKETSGVFPAEGSGIGEPATELPSSPLDIGSKTGLAESPSTTLNVRRPATQKLGPPIAEDNIGTPATSKRPGNPLVADGFAQDSLKEVVTADIKRNKIYAPPAKPQRPFEADYTEGVKADEVDAAGNLLVDRHGKPFNPGDMIFGRRTLGGDDVGARHEDFMEIGERLMGKPIKMVPRAHIDGKSGRVPFDPTTNKPDDIFLADDLDMSKSRSRHIADHEISHVIDLKTGRKPLPPQVWKELESVYSTLATGKENLPKLTLPADRNYSGPKIRDELATEGYRAALKDQNFMKTEAPKAYDWLAEQLATLGIRVNSLGAATVAALGAMGQRNDSEAAEAPEERDSQTSSFRGMGPLPGPSVPFEPAGKAAKKGANGQTELVKALSRRGLYPQAPKNGKFRDLVRALVDLETKQKSQFYGGPM